MYKRRIVLGGIASATILASGVLMAGTALAVTPQLPAAHPAVGPLIAGSPMSQVPGVVGALQAAASPLGGRSTSVNGAMSRFNGAMSKFNGVTSKFNGMTGAIPGLPGVAGAAQGLHPDSLAGRSLRGGALGRGVTGGSTLPAAGSVPGLGNAMGDVNKMTGDLGSASIPALGGLTDAAPGLSQAAKVLGAGF